mgnify:CR=1 FL=1
MTDSKRKAQRWTKDEAKQEKLAKLLEYASLFGSRDGWVCSITEKDDSYMLTIRMEEL